MFNIHAIALVCLKLFFFCVIFVTKINSRFCFDYMFWLKFIVWDN